MENKRKIVKKFQDASRTQLVFIENSQVVLKEETPEEFFVDTNIAEWFPTDFRREPARV